MKTAIILAAIALAGCSTVQTSAIPADDSRASMGARENTNPLGADQVNSSYSKPLRAR